MEKPKSHILSSLLAFCMLLNLAVPAFAITPPPGYTQITEAGGTGTTSIHIQIDASGSGGGGEDPDNPGGGGGEDPDNPGGGGEDDPDNTLYSYLIQYHYDDSLEKQAGQGHLYDLIPYDMTTPKTYAGHNWLLERFNISKFIVADESQNTAELWYTIDDKDKDGNDVSGGDGIPDKYQDPTEPIEPAQTFKYSVAYNYENEDNGQLIEGVGTVGSVIPYSAPNTTTYNSKMFQLSKVAAKSNIITPEEALNKVDIDYNSLKEENKDDVPSDDNSELYVTFDPANGDRVTTVRVPYGSTVDMPAAPSKPGYVFLYWASGSDAFDFSTPITSNTALVAQYRVEAGTVAYKVQHYQEQAGAGGAFPGYKLAAEETLLGTVNSQVSAVAKNYVGFKEDTANTNRVASGTLIADSNLVLRLFYAKDVVTVTIDPDNGDAMQIVEVPNGAVASAPETPEKPGYTFAGWTVNGVPMDFNNPITEDITIKATWTLIPVTASYKVEHYKEQAGAEGAFPGYVLADTENLEGPLNTVVSAVAKKYVGFKEDAANNNRVASGTLAAGSDLVLRLFYNKQMFTVTVDPDNGTGVTTAQVPYGSTISIPDEPAKTGYEFDGWAINGVPVDFSKPITGDVTIKAIWREVKAQANYKVEHYWENLNDDGFTLHETETIGSQVDTSVRAVAKSYIGFTEDKNNANRNEAGVVKADGSLTLKLYYTRNIYTVTIDPGNGDSPTQEEIKYGTPINKPSDPNYDDHTVIGWKDKDTGAAIQFPMDVTGDITITPIWRDNTNPANQYSYKITYHYGDKAEVVEGVADEGSKLPYATPANKVYSGKNYVFVNKWVASETITSSAEKNQADVYYELDEAGKNGTSNSGDGIPDKYQISVYFRANHGSVSHGVVVITKLDKNGNPSVDGTAKLAKSDIPSTSANYGYRRGVWDKTPVEGMEVKDGDLFVISYSRIPSSGGGGNSGSSGGGSHGGSGSHRPGNGGSNNGNNNGSNNGGNNGNGNGSSLADLLLDKGNHKAYIHGYPNGNVSPNNNITRGEVAQIIYNLMKDDARDYYYTTQNKFSDVGSGLWCNTAISTIAKAGIITGFPNGEYGYNKAITRAEFATIVSKFTNVDANGANSFNDVEGHWAKNYILKVAAAGWVKGYPNGDFRPNATLTRAEAVTILNKILERGTDVNHMLKGMKVWPDNKLGAWYYEAIQEASNGHNYKVIKGVESWTELVNK